MKGRIRIVAVPMGEAPRWVREKWVGLELPLLVGSAHNVHTFGVLSGPRGFFSALWRLVTGHSTRRRGYAVEVDAAMSVLERAHPDAAAWWRTNAPHLFTRGRFFLFREEECRPIDDMARR
jgi:hypothetical protein